MSLSKSKWEFDRYSEHMLWIQRIGPNPLEPIHVCLKGMTFEEKHLLDRIKDKWFEAVGHIPTILFEE